MQQKSDLKICHFSSVHKWNDIRIFKKMCVSLAANGFQVTLVAPNAEEGMHNGVQVVSVNVDTSSRFKRMFKTAKSVYKKALSIEADVYHFHDPELLRYGKRLSRRGKKVVYDSHEDVPADILDKSYLGPVWLRKIISKLYNSYEKKLTLKLSGVISVSDPITQKFSNQNKITIHNYPIISTFKKTNDVVKTAPIKINYSGGLTRIRGIKEMIDGLGFMEEDTQMIIAGQWESDDYFSECKSSPGWQKVDYLGLISLEENYATMAKCHIGIVNFLPVANHLNALPNKAFEYFAAGLVVQMSNLDFWLKEFGDYANYHDPNNPKEIGAALDKLVRKSSELDALGQKGKAYVLEHKSWESQAVLLENFYQHLVAN